MITICWNGHRFEYLQDQTTCHECGEYGQHQEFRRFAPGEAEAIADQLRTAQEHLTLEFAFKRGYQQGFAAGILAEERRINNGVNGVS